MNKQLQRDLLNKQLNSKLNKQLEKGIEELFGTVFGGLKELEKESVKEDNLSAFDKSAKEMYSYYQSFIKAGFNEEQSFELFLKLVPKE